MTKLSSRKSKLSFVTEAEVRYRGRLRPVVIEVAQDGYNACVRLAGTRMRYEFSWHGLHDWAAEMHVRRERERVKKERKERKAALAGKAGSLWELQRRLTQ